MIKVLVIAAVTIDGFIGQSMGGRLKLSSQEDLDDIKKIRAEYDGILVGANTIRNDDSTLITTSDELVQYRLAQGKCKDPIKITLTKSGNISLGCNFITKGDCEKIIYTTNAIDIQKEIELSKHITLVKMNEDVLKAEHIIHDLNLRGVKSLIVEGGTSILTLFFEENLVDELRLSVVPFFIGDHRAPRLVHDGIFFFDKNHRMELTHVEKLGDTAVLHYKLKNKAIN